MELVIYSSHDPPRCGHCVKPEQHIGNALMDVLNSQLKATQNNRKTEIHVQATTSVKSRMHTVIRAAPLILNLGARCRWLVYIMPRLLYRRYAFNSRLRANQNPSGRSAVEKILLPPPGMKPRIVQLGYCTDFVAQDSSVGIATRYGLVGPGIESRWGRDFPHPSRPALEPTQTLIQ